MTTIWWRAGLLLAGIGLMAGGPRHPSPHPELPFGESTALMLANDAWVPSHLLMLAAFLCLLIALAIWRQQAELSPQARRWTGLALVAVALAVVEMGFHTAAVVDLERLRAGSATPILTTHLILAATVNPLLAVALSVVALQGARARQLGSRWTVWVVVLGSGIFGVASSYVVITHDQRVSPFFAIGSALMAIWFILTGLWPVRRTDAVPASASG